MTTYAIGDIQGCYEALRRLLDRLSFDPATDSLWFVGDLVNRGPDSLRTLRFVKSLGSAAVTVLGNHDLHLLALSEGNEKHQKKSNLDKVLDAPDRDDLLYWLRHRPIFHHDPERQFSMIHAGLAPQWTLAEARSYAGELENILRGPGYREYLADIYGNQPEQWNDSLTGMDRLRFITNCFTRLRYCDKDGNLNLKEKGPLGAQSKSVMPWFQVPNRKTRGDRIIFGHWSTLGYYAGDNILAIDSGCVWGGQLTAIEIKRSTDIKVVTLDCSGLVDAERQK